MNYDLIQFSVFVWIQLFVMLYEYLIKNWLSSRFAVGLLVDPLICSKSHEYSQMVPTNIYFYLQEEVHRYLRVTHSTLEIDFFNFEWYVHVFNHFTPERKFYKIDDISYGKENAPVSCVNSLDNNYPEYVRTHHMFSRILSFLFVIVFSREK